MGLSGARPGVCASVLGVALPDSNPHLHPHPDGRQLRGGGGRAVLRAVHVRGQGGCAARALRRAELHQCQPGTVHAPPLSPHPPTPSVMSQLRLIRSCVTHFYCRSVHYRARALFCYNILSPLLVTCACF